MPCQLRRAGPRVYDYQHPREHTHEHDRKRATLRDTSCHPFGHSHPDGYQSSEYRSTGSPFTSFDFGYLTPT
ncbi:hypothetical protein C8Q74DRAFT_1224628 [Fomes fomentarius]|nr:hypothetical protein C8Q74DRAFT_1224628 [Fomes fomentarius]